MTRVLPDLTGRKQFKLTILGRSGAMWNVRCDCGNEKSYTRQHLKRVKSCGCYRTDFNLTRNHKHGDAQRGKTTAEYRAWCGMRRRCSNVNDDNYAYYGGRGIVVCDRWKDSYPAFLEDMGRKPSPQHSIDRIDVDGNYEPSNCRWVLFKEQSRNRRGQKPVVIDGRTMSAAEAAETAGVPYKIFLSRLDRGWEPATALSTPVLAPFGGLGNERLNYTTKIERAVNIAMALTKEEFNAFLIEVSRRKASR